MTTNEAIVIELQANIAIDCNATCKSTGGEGGIGAEQIEGAITNGIGVLGGAVKELESLTSASPSFAPSVEDTMTKKRSKSPKSSKTKSSKMAKAF